MDTQRNLSRRHDLDWLRVLAILVLHGYHTGMVFCSWGFHIKNSERLPALDLPMAFLHQWRMPLLFFISGIGTVLALRSRSLGGFFVERSRRLLVPLVFGMIVIVPPQIYFERLASGETFPSYLAFWKTIFDLVSYPQGNTSWHHLWFVAYLFVYCLLALPMLALLRSTHGRAWQQALCHRLASGAWLYLLAVPVAATQLALRSRWPERHNLTSDWANLTFQGLFFLFGILIGTDASVWDRITAQRRTSLLLGIVTLTILLVDDVLGTVGGYPYSIEHTLLCALTWFWVLAAAGYGRRLLSFRNRFLDYASEAIYPFYILHQTAIIVLGASVVGWSLGAASKFLLLLVASFLVSWLLYAIAIRPFAFVRPFFGMKARSPRAAVNPLPDVPLRLEYGSGR